MKAALGARMVASNRPDEPGAITPDEARHLRQYLADLPSPADFAYTLPSALIEALASAYRAREGTRLTDTALIGHLRRLGLVEMGGPYLSNFGTAVRRALIEG